jgi:lipoprotein-anchoring transpeptidase ErfK/SrfK
MRYWMRLTPDGVGHHIGPIRRYPASHGCIRGPSATIPTVYSKVKIGTPVVVE